MGADGREDGEMPSVAWVSQASSCSWFAPCLSRSRVARGGRNRLNKTSGKLDASCFNCAPTSGSSIIVSAQNTDVDIGLPLVMLVTVVDESSQYPVDSLSIF